MPIGHRSFPESINNLQSQYTSNVWTAGYRSYAGGMSENNPKNECSKCGEVRLAEVNKPNLPSHKGEEV